MTEPWYLQDSRIAKIVLEVLNCPSNSGKENPSIDPFFEFASQTLQSPLGNTLATTDYVFSKGANDAFCINSDSIPNSERGLFDYNLNGACFKRDRWTQPYFCCGRRGQRTALEALSKPWLYHARHAPNRCFQVSLILLDNTGLVPEMWQIF